MKDESIRSLTHKILLSLKIYDKSDRAGYDDIEYGEKFDKIYNTIQNHQDFRITNERKDVFVHGEGIAPDSPVLTKKRSLMFDAPDDIAGHIEKGTGGVPTC